MISTVLVAIDGSEHASKTIAFAAELGSSLDAGFVVLHVREWLLGPNAALDEGREAAHGLVDQAVKELASEGVNARGLTKGTRVGHVAEVIAKVAEAEGAQLIIVGSHKGSNLTRVLLGAVSRSLVGLGEVPVLVVPAGGNSGR